MAIGSLIIEIILIALVSALGTALFAFLIDFSNRWLSKKIPLEKDKYNELMRKIKSKEYSQKLKKYRKAEVWIFSFIWLVWIFYLLFTIEYFTFYGGPFQAIFLVIVMFILSIGHVATVSNFIVRIVFKIFNYRESSFILYYSSQIMNPGMNKISGFKPKYSIEKFNSYYIFIVTPILLALLLAPAFLA